MRLHTFADPEGFERRASSYLQKQEAAHSRLLGTLTTLKREPWRFSSAPYLSLVEQDGAVVAVAVRIPPHDLVLSVADFPGAVTLFADDLAALRDLPGVSGTLPESSAFVARWLDLTGQDAVISMSQRVYQLERVEAVRDASGSLRRATVDDRSFLLECGKAFSKEALGESPDEASLARGVDASFHSQTGGFWLWEDGQRVAMAFAGNPTPNGIRIGAVYTPPESRNKGYASALISALSQHLLNEGRRFCFLYTDLANPTSNHIYQAIGFRPVCDVAVYRFQG